ncbi:hypothetical protein MTP99_005207 [Tenebrio molitor]|jgi:hypothetical protein|uniref:uncharacterized protein n=1 Tax=Tenebrio molitor TaxID=7067 RepID=UPI001C3B6AF9|nr:hypothetical protein MTP99_005207 [Tenebrio molitor]CAH1381224.1 unnamed protein product [Tenebrio molitor]
MHLGDVLSVYLILNTLAVSRACMVKVLSQDSDGSFLTTFTYVDCNTLFEVCCEQGCCPRFSHAHIWIFAATFSFIIFLCIFGCWLICRKKVAQRNRTVLMAPQIDDHVDSPMVTLVVPDNRAVASSRVQNTNPVPVTPPPTYEEATSTR